MKKITTEDFIAKAREVHDDKYSYEKTIKTLGNSGTNFIIK